MAYFSAFTTEAIAINTRKRDFIEYTILYSSELLHLIYPNHGITMRAHWLVIVLLFAFCHLIRVIRKFRDSIYWRMLLFVQLSVLWW